MDEMPEGFSLPSLEARAHIPSASVMLSREAGDGHEVLMGHRSSELPAFPDLWSFPGGGVSRVDRRASERHPEWFSEMGEDRLSVFTLLREMVEEVGISPDGNGGFVEVNDEVREIVCKDKSGWLKVVESGMISTEGFECEIITERITPPQSPTRFHNLFFHVSLGESGVEPSFPPGRSEFDEFRWWRSEEIIESWERNELHVPPPILTIFRDLLDKMQEMSLVSACAEMAEDPPSGPHRFEYGPGVECILIPTNTLPPSTHTNCFVLGERGGDRLIVDPAIKDQDGFELLRLKVEEIHADGSDVVATIFTHRHQDHLGDLGMIEEIYHAPIWASHETLDALPGGGQRRTLNEGEVIGVRGPNGISNWEVLETPGHCPGQICLVGEPGIVSADNCTMVGTILVPSNDGDMGAYIEGLERLRRISAPTLFPSHGPLIPNPERILSQYIKHRKARHERVFEAVESGASRLSEISEIAYSDTPDAHPILAKDQTLSHLRLLVDSGRLRHSGERFDLGNAV
jgi:glyoxylase-like metal-dependent hydrolase (beta-lactamase superfamily II)/8-oxo-dGTP pyrophosphatase MutT (NUDIX family)|tara:strand:- start:209 stop:1759 length:1551 start_codon:yes stop_codon:yes gene_type:complete